MLSAKIVNRASQRDITLHIFYGSDYSYHVQTSEGASMNLGPIETTDTPSSRPQAAFQAPAKWQ